ncbi:MAG: DUF1223 domain-containing protein [Gammaproteobacteria bacterium]|nr:DUF1223 domain-containing protein [Gammaproteobacteria bacterium]MBU0788698.1 DUF1223 domain-containing protein [Gammaproteobacteria bacterium]MBU0814683.1 DUF1223 domain-containing protein [Gammaproteobacteria bacterium]MBU1786474.1 DUF1223 domain-containing protein [Gammaproteobacteria bacterium]
MKNTIKFIAVCAVMAGATASFSMENGCAAQSGAQVTPVIELYTSEGCSSCPPADQWLSTLKGKPLVVQAFHVGYWDYIGWVDRFATPANTTRQREIAARNHQRSIYTPQAVLNGADWRNWRNGLPGTQEPARTSISLRQLGPDQFEAVVTTHSGAPSSWGAYWTVTEHGHSSNVKAGENAGEYLQHDFVVRQYTLAGEYKGDASSPQKLTLRSIAPNPGHPRQINMVVFDPQTGKTLQAVSAAC